MQLDAQRFEVRLAETEEEVASAQRLRYRVFVEEMGARAAAADHAARLEKDAFDPVFDHLILIDHASERTGLDRVVGVYRLLPGVRAAEGRGFYGASEYDLSKLVALGPKTLELGRSCVDAAYRGGVAMHLLWSALGGYVQERGITVLFGVASFPGADPDRVAEPLSYLHHHHLAPEDLRVRTLPAHFVPMDRLPADAVDRTRAMRDTPALIKAYLRLGGVVGEGAYVDRDFNTVDVCLIMDTTRMVAKYRTTYTRRADP